MLTRIMVSQNSGLETWKENVDQNRSSINMRQISNILKIDFINSHWKKQKITMIDLMCASVLKV